MNRRNYIVGLSSFAIIGSTAGCLDENGDIEVSSQPAGLTEAQKEQYNYETELYTRLTFTQEISAVDRTINGYIESTGFSDSNGSGIVFLTTPDFTFLNQNYNPVDSLSTEDIVTILSQLPIGVEIDEDDITKVGEREIQHQMDDESYTVEEYTTVVGTVGSQEILARLYIGIRPVQDASIISIGYHLDSLDKEDQIIDLLTSFEYPSMQLLSEEPEIVAVDELL